MADPKKPTRDFGATVISLSEPEQKLLDQPPASTVEARLTDLEQTLAATSVDDVAARARLELDMAGLLLDLDRKSEAYDRARPLVTPLLAQSLFEDAALACQFLYLAGQDDAIAALGQAAWLAVSYPIDPNLTANILSHIIDETPDDADGAAVAAATAQYVANLRGSEDKQEELTLFTGAMLAQVARRHSNVQSQSEFEAWVEKLELDQPQRFLVRLRNVIDVMTQDDWWFDREKLQREFSDSGAA